ncbi:NupC/NupG family nucleoside CNT transporter [Metabacillus iocasae]|uniref:Nucleoside permease n=1 Tax=Priestia iocasae TaxID=2291674 RepID=A0ABS2QVW1_9BACI|nr:NupC/NupG family nucleoside CNT transporter [Metabacillus iocasae]MBM7703629.1 CNT family concentrative nucleoside transporter [Metabacillus iocasae]
MNLIWGIFGIIVILLIALGLSKNRKAIRVQTVAGALGLQIFFAILVLYWEPGKKGLEAISAIVLAFLGASSAGIEFVFGDMIPEGAFTVAVNLLPILIYIAAVTSLLYYLGVLQLVVKIIGGAMQKLLKTSKAESMSATANIFVGLTEAPLVIRPYLNKMTTSELFAVMVGGLATVAGTVLSGYYMLGAKIEYLIAASFMAAPAGLLIAKIMVPETEEPETGIGKDTKTSEVEEGKPKNMIDAIAQGASEGLKLALNVGAMLIAFISIIKLANLMLGKVGTWIGIENLTFEMILGYVFAPIMFVIGVPWSEATAAGSYLGQKMILNEFVAFANFAPIAQSFTPKTEAIITFTLTGFAGLGSLAILLGGLGALIPSRRGDIAQFGLLAIVGGTLANLLSAAIAGMLIG